MPRDAVLAIVEQALLSSSAQHARIASPKNSKILSWKLQKREISIKIYNFFFSLPSGFYFHLHGSVNAYSQFSSSQSQELNKS